MKTSNLICPKLFQFVVVCAACWSLHANAADWSAFSIIETYSEGGGYKETVFLVNDSSKPVTLNFPNFMFPGHGNTPAESISPMGAFILAPGEAVQFIHIIAANRKQDFADSLGIQDIKDVIPIKRLFVKGTIERQNHK